MSARRERQLRRPGRHAGGRRLGAGPAVRRRVRRGGAGDHRPLAHVLDAHAGRGDALPLPDGAGAARADRAHGVSRRAQRPRAPGTCESADGHRHRPPGAHHRGRPRAGAPNDHHVLPRAAGAPLRGGGRLSLHAPGRAARGRPSRPHPSRIGAPDARLQRRGGRHDAAGARPHVRRSGNPQRDPAAGAVRLLHAGGGGRQRAGPDRSADHHGRLPALQPARRAWRHAAHRRRVSLLLPARGGRRAAGRLPAGVLPG